MERERELPKNPEDWTDADKEEYFRRLERDVGHAKEDSDRRKQILMEHPDKPFLFRSTNPQYLELCNQSAPWLFRRIGALEFAKVGPDLQKLEQEAPSLESSLEATAKVLAMVSTDGIPADRFARFSDRLLKEALYFVLEISGYLSSEADTIENPQRV